MYGHLAFATLSNTEGCVRCKHLHVALSRSPGYCRDIKFCARQFLKATRWRMSPKKYSFDTISPGIAVNMHWHLSLALNAATCRSNLLDANGAVACVMFT